MGDNEIKHEIQSIFSKISQNENRHFHRMNSVEFRRNQLEHLKVFLEEKRRIVPIRTFLKLTKTESSASDCYLFRDLELENQVDEYLQQKTSFETVMGRYNEYDKNVLWKEWPKHYAVRVLAGNGPITSGKNIFLFFQKPYVYSLKESKTSSDWNSLTCGRIFLRRLSFLV